EHFKKAVVPLGASNIFYVGVFATSSSDFLAGDNTRGRRRCLPQEVRHKRNHSCRGEQQGWIIGNQAGAGQIQVRTLISKVSDKLLPNLSASQSIHRLHISSIADNPPMKKSGQMSARRGRTCGTVNYSRVRCSCPGAKAATVCLAYGLTVVVLAEAVLLR